VGFVDVCLLGNGLRNGSVLVEVAVLEYFFLSHGAGGGVNTGLIDERVSSFLGGRWVGGGKCYWADV
jgi:hypothetical protein